MGTNWYWRDRFCNHCGRFEDIHVCKSKTTWRAYRNTLESPTHPDWGYLEQSPFGFPVLCLADWREVFQRPGELRNEYGDVVADPIEWLAQAKPWKPGPDGHRYLDDDISAGQGWLDPDGYRFYAEDFR